MQFSSKIFFCLFVLAPVFALLYLYRERRKGAITFSDIGVFKTIAPSQIIRAMRILPILRLAAVALLVVVIARPQSTHKTEDVLAQGIDIILTLDISGSMKAEDFKPLNRFEAAKMVIAEFVQKMRNNRLGLVVYSGQAFTQCPLTLDYGVLIGVVNNLKMGVIEDGTAIGMAIATSVSRLKKSDSKSKVIILLTDGRNNRGEIDPQTAAQIAKTFGIKIYTIGVGREGGAPIPIDDPVFGKQYARNPDGSLFMEEPDENLLMEIARITGGRYFRATDEKKLSSIYSDIAGMEKTKIKTEQKINYTEYFQYFLIPSIALLALELLLASTRLRVVP